MFCDIVSYTYSIIINPVLLAFLFCAIFMVVIGFVGYKRVKTSSEYVLGGRSLGALVGALSAEASDMSAWLFMGLPGAVYIAGTGQAWIAVGLLAGTIANWLFVAKRLRTRSFSDNDAITIPAFFANSTVGSVRMKKALQTVSSAFIIVFFTVYVGSGFVAGGKFFSSIFGTSYFTAMVITAIIVLLYTFLGGFLSIAWTSVAQGLLMIIAVVGVPLSAIILMGGITESFAVGANVGTDNADIVTIISNLAWGLGYFGMPHIIIKYMALKDTKTATKSGIIAIIWCAISLSAAVIIGEVGRSFIGADTLDEIESENLFTVLIHRIFIDNGQFIIAFVGGLFLCAILSAIMSTAASQLLMTSSSFVFDIWGAVFTHKKPLTDKVKLWFSRIVVLFAAIVGFIIALNPQSMIMGLVSMSWAGFGATFGPVVLLILYRKKVSTVSALAGIIAGGITVLIWPLLPVVSALYEIVPGFAVCLGVILTVDKIFDYSR